MNILPFGYHETFTIRVGSDGDTRISEFYLEPSVTLSDRKKKDDGTPFRELNGIATAILKPKGTTKDASIKVAVEGDGVSLVAPQTNFDPTNFKWDYTWDFTKGAPNGLINQNTFPFDESTYFDGTATVEVASSTNDFENTPFTLYVEWAPSNSSGNGQQIVGHYNWELLQNTDSVVLQVGRMDNKDGQIYSIKYKTDNDFFTKRHSAIAIYSPSETNGYIELFVDGSFVHRLNIGSGKIWGDYNQNKNLSWGWTSHNFGKNAHFKGSIFQTRIKLENLIPSTQEIAFKSETSSVRIPVVSATTTVPVILRAEVEQN